MKSYTVAYFSYLRATFGALFFLTGVYLFWYMSHENIPYFTRNTSPTLIVLDHSLSMTVEDISDTSNTTNISRLDLAKELIEKKLQEIKEGGLILYAKNPTLFFPIHTIQDELYTNIKGISGEERLGGSNLPGALIFARNLYGDIPLFIDIYTDGGNTSESEIANIPKNWKITLHGIGTPLGGKIPLGYSATGERRYKYYSGSEIIVPYESNSMKNLAKTLNARLIEYTTLGKSSESIQSSFLGGNSLYFFALFCFIFGIALHPYGRKKIIT